MVSERGTFSRAVKRTGHTGAKARSGVLVTLGLAIGVFASPGQPVFANELAVDLPVSALEACVSPAEERTRVYPTVEQDIFQSESGDRFFAADIRRPEGTGSEGLVIAAGAFETGSLQAVRAGPANRWGLYPAWLITVDEGNEQLVQARTLEQGDVLYAPERSSGICAAFLGHAEDIARARESGLWHRVETYPVLDGSDPVKLQSVVGHYVIARGRIVSLGKTRSTRYLNFGKYWKTDFTVTLKASDEESFDQALVLSGTRVEDLAGRMVELRGVVQLKDGPLIALGHPGQLKVLDNNRARRGSQNVN